MGVRGAVGLGENLYLMIKKGSSGGDGAYKRFPNSIKKQAATENPTRTCPWCRLKGVATDLDHIIARIKGGNNTLANAEYVCPHCNRSKGAGEYPKTPPAGYTGKWPPSWWNKIFNIRK